MQERRISILVPLTLEGIGDEPLEQLLEVYEANKQPGTVLEVDRVRYGPSTIESRYDEELSAAFSIQAMERALDRGVDGILGSCFGDVALIAGRELARVPVVGTGQASMTVAAGIGRKFSIINLCDGSEPLMEDLVRRYGFSDLFAGVVTIGMGVADLIADESGDTTRLRAVLLDAGQRAVADGADVLLLGCGGFGLAGITDWLGEQLGVTVIDPNVVALRFLEMIIDCGLCHSERGYPTPGEKIRRLPPDS